MELKSKDSSVGESIHLKGRVTPKMVKEPMLEGQMDLNEVTLDELNTVQLNKTNRMITE